MSDDGPKLPEGAASFGPNNENRIHEWLAEIQQERSPFIDVSTFPENDRQRARRINSSFHLLTGFIGAFNNDLDLFDYANSTPDIMMKWAPIACRDAALNLWGFKDAIDYIQTGYSRCKSAKTRERDEAMRSAVALFDASFPDAKDMRDITAHSVGHMAGRGRGKSHAIRGVVLVHNSWAGRRVINSHEGREISFELSVSTVRSLRGIRKIIFDSFRGPHGF